MTAASAAEVEAAQKARRDHEVAVGGTQIAPGLYRGDVCMCGFDYDAAGLTFWQHQAQAVADAVVAAAQPRIAAETLREAAQARGERGYFGDAMTRNWLRARADEIEARP